jgi:predicted site-specific integrase-resolvase
MNKRYASTREAADELGVSTGSLLRWAKAGLVKPVLRTAQRGDYRWDVDDLRHQLQARDEPSHGSKRRRGKSKAG